MLSKVPQVTLVFWVTKVLTTGMGETTSDYLVTHFDPVLAAGVTGLVLIASLVLQFSVRRYVPWVYWFVVVMVSVVGTMFADIVHVVLGVPYLVSTSAFLILLAVIFIAWYAREKTLSIHSIYTLHRELFYWATVLATFALGTATGDMTATTLHLGYLPSGILFAVLMLIPVVGYFWLGFNEIFAFWFAYILTRPLGASFSDWMGVAQSRGGLGWGTGPVSLVLLILIICLVGYLAFTHEDAEKKPLA